MEDLEFELLIKQEFLQEAEEILQNFEFRLLKVNVNTDSTAVLNEMFRYAHSLKGAGLAAGFDGLGNLAHKVENLLDRSSFTNSFRFRGQQLMPCLAG
jgi:chemotaxis protein histidine kinase CheA